MSATVRIMIDQWDGSTVELGSIENKEDRISCYANESLAEDSERRDFIVLTLFRWVGKLYEFVEIQDQKKEKE